MEFSLLKIYKIAPQTLNQKFLNTICNWQHQHLSYFVLYCEFLNLKLWTWLDRISAKYWHKPKNFIIVASEILSMKNEMSCFAPVSQCAPGYTKKGQLLVGFTTVFLTYKLYKLHLSIIEYSRHKQCFIWESLNIVHKICNSTICLNNFFRSRNKPARSVNCICQISKWYLLFWTCSKFVQ